MNASSSKSICYIRSLFIYCHMTEVILSYYKNVNVEISDSPYLRRGRIVPLQRLMTQEVVVIGHNKSCAPSSSKRSFSGPKSQLDIYCWAKGQQKIKELDIRPQMREYTSFVLNVY